MSAQVNARELVTVGAKSVERLETGGVVVVTFRQIDDVHSRPEGTAKLTFNRNKRHLAAGKDYFVCDTYEAKSLGITAPNGVTLLTETGYLKLVKTFSDDLAWKIQGQLVDCYFRRKETTPVPTPAPNQVQILEAMLAAIKTQQADQMSMMNDIHDVKLEVAHLKQTIAQAPAQIPVKDESARPIPAIATDTRSMRNPLYAKFRKLYHDKTAVWFKKKFKVPLSNETITKTLYRNERPGAMTLTILCSHLKMSQEETRAAAAFFGTEDPHGIIDRYISK